MPNFTDELIIQLPKTTFLRDKRAFRLRFCNYLLSWIERCFTFFVFLHQTSTIMSNQKLVSAYIIDDNLDAIEVLARMLENNYSVKVIGKATDAETAVRR